MVQATCATPFSRELLVSAVAVMDDEELRDDITTLADEWRDVGEKVEALAERTRQIEKAADCGPRGSEIVQLVRDYVGLGRVVCEVGTIRDAVEYL